VPARLDDLPLIPPWARPLVARIAVAFLLAVPLLAGWMRLAGPLPGERRLARWKVDPVTSEPWRNATDLLSALGTPIPAIALLLVVGWVVHRRLGPRAATFLTLATAVTLTTDGLKQIFGPTPIAREAFGGVAAYPSGHVVWATAFFGALALLGARRRIPDLLLPSLLVLVAMGPSRILVGAHALGDVLGGYLLGAGWVLAAALLVDRAAARRSIRSISAAEGVTRPLQ